MTYTRFNPNKGHSLSKEHAGKISAALKGRVKTATPTYRTIHAWLTANFGKPDSCESKSCEKRSITFDWALLEGKEHARDRSFYMKLCRVCHSLYDRQGQKSWETRRLQGIR